MNGVRATIVLVLMGSLVVPASSRATPGPHAVTGTVQVQDGTWLGLSAPDVELPGRAWLGHGVPAPSIEIELDCVQVSWHRPVYPIPPYLPYHLVQASGLGSDGVRYFITAYDVVARPLGFGDHAAVTSTPAQGACEANPDAAVPIKTGDLAVLP